MTTMETDNIEIENPDTISEEATKTQQQQQQFPQELPLKQGEVMSQYIQRKQVYLNAFKELQDHDKAYCYANVYVNITFLKSKYPSSLTAKVMKFAPQI